MIMLIKKIIHILYFIKINANKNIFFSYYYILGNQIHILAYTYIFYNLLHNKFWVVFFYFFLYSSFLLSHYLSISYAQQFFIFFMNFTSFCHPKLYRTQIIKKKKPKLYSVILFPYMFVLF